MPYTKSAHFYDVLNSANGKNYAYEAKVVHQLVQHEKSSPGTRLLDIGCGTGEHIRYLKQHYSITGVDIDAEMLHIAQAKHPEVSFHHSDMLNVDLNQQYDVIICLFSAIAYVRTFVNVCHAVRRMSEHLVSGGVMLVEGWFTPEMYREGNISVRVAEQPEMKIVRMDHSTREGNVAVVLSSFLVGTPRAVEHFTERHEFGLFTREEYERAFQQCGLSVHVDMSVLTGRGVYIARK